MRHMSRTEFNKNFMIVYHPSQKKRWKSKLVGLDKMKALIDDDAIFEEQLNIIEQSVEDNIWLRIRERLAFNVIAR